MDAEKLLDPNSYTEKAMPISAMLCNQLDLTKLGYVSEETIATRNRNAEQFNEFVATLTKTQGDMFSKVYQNKVDEYADENIEYFNRGMRFGALLMMELLGGGLK